MRLIWLLENTYIKSITDHQILHRKSIVVIFFFTLIIGCGVFMKKEASSKETSLESSRTLQPTNLLDGCQYVYVDLGTNIGIQIRKLYEPHLYPKGMILPYFKEVFGNHSNEVCSIGFEANPVHEKYLKEFEEYCLRRKWRVKIFTSTAVDTKEGNVTFFRDENEGKNNQWGASLLAMSYGTNEKITVRSIDIVSWFKRNVLNRKVSSGAPTKIMMKTDLERYDPVVMTQFILSGVYCSIDVIYGEHLDNNFRQAISTLHGYSKSCKTKLIYMDDETYYKDRFPFIVR